MPSHPIVGVAVALLFCPLSCPAQNFTWARTTPSVSPTPRWGPTRTYDAARGESVLFGGAEGGNFDETWIWDGAGWTQVFPATVPTARHCHAAAYDRIRSRVVMFGGPVPGSAPSNPAWLDGTWSWNGTDWSLHAPATRPPGRDCHAMAFDVARDRIVLFGGKGAGGILGDTWEWDGTTWAQRTPVHAPSARYGHKMAYDVGLQRTVLFGGREAFGSVFSGDTWVWDGVDWTEVAIGMPSPPPRLMHTMTYDSGRQRVVVHSGIVGASQQFADDTWEWDGTAWQQRAAAVTGPDLHGQTMVYDEANERLTIFTGWRAQTWIGRDARYPATSAAYGSGCGPQGLALVSGQASAPILGQTVELVLAHAPSYVAGVSIGWRDDVYAGAPLPLDLASIGMPGCSLLHSADQFYPMTVAAVSTMEFAIQLPWLPALLGTRAFAQAFVIDPGENALQLVSSNGIAWRLGDS